jgi:two-component system cell cycle response regulator
VADPQNLAPDGEMRAELRRARQRFVGTFPKRCEELALLARAATDAATRDEFARAVHRLVGAAGLVGFKELSRLASTLEQDAKAGTSTAADLATRLEGLRDAYARDDASPPDWVGQEDPTRPPSLTLVIAEDDDVQRQAMTRFLEASGHAVTGVARGDEVLAVVRRQLPGILVLDVQLPGLDGYAVCRQVKSDPALAAVAVVFVTAAITTDDRLAGLLLGADDYVEKPVDLAELGTRLSLVAERRARAASQPQRIAVGELAYPDFVSRASDTLQQSGGAVVLLRMPADMGLRVATWLVGELRRDDLLGRYRDDLRVLLLPGLLPRTAARHVADIVARLAAAGLPVSMGMAVTERPGERSFSALLQEADGQLAAAASGAAPAPGVPGAAPPVRRSVLVADDDEMTRRIAERPLTHAGYTCRMAVDGQHALDEVLREPPDVLVLDLSMPRLDGLQVLEAMRQHGGPRPRVVVISANRQEDDVRKALALGADDYVVKPFNPLTLLARVRRVMP